MHYQLHLLSIILLTLLAGSAVFAALPAGYAAMSGARLPDGPTQLREDDAGRMLIAIAGTHGQLAIVDGDTIHVLQHGDIGGVTVAPGNVIWYTNGPRVMSLHPSNPMIVTEQTAHFSQTGATGMSRGIYCDRLGTLWVDGEPRLLDSDGHLRDAPSSPVADSYPAPRLTDQYGNQWHLAHSVGNTAPNIPLLLPAQAPVAWVGSDAPVGHWTSLVADQWGYIWIAGTPGVRRFDPRHAKDGWVAYPTAASYPGGAVLAMGLSAHGVPLVALPAGGLYELELQGKQPLVTPVEIAGLSSQPIRAIQTDTAGRTWVVAGGQVFRCAAPADAWQRHWQALAPMPQGDHDIFATALDGKVYVAGGLSNLFGCPTTRSYFDRMFILNLKANSWSVTPPMSVKRCYCGVAPLEGKIWVVGGAINGGAKQTILNLVEIYDPKTGAWQTGPPLDIARFESVVVTVGKRIYAIGGANKDNQAVASAASIGPGETVWRAETAAPDALRQFAGGALGTTIYIMVGGQGLWAYDTITRQWHTDLAKFPNNHPPRAAAVGAHAGEIWVIGGQDTKAITGVWHYTPATNSWAAGPDVPDSISWGATAAVAGQFLVIGGAGPSTPEPWQYNFWDHVYRLR
jgi:N-acetylneuraminic acid mutarotase